MTTEVDFMMGEPKRSQRMIVMKTEKPRPERGVGLVSFRGGGGWSLGSLPRYSAEPHGRACGAVMSGHSAKNSSGLASAQRPEPPAQFLKPEEIRLMPISMTVGPVTMGGKMRSMTLGGMKEMRISSSEQTAEVPRRAP